MPTDSERLEWIERQGAGTNLYNDVGEWRILAGKEFRPRAAGSILRDAIDAAMSATPPVPHSRDCTSGEAGDGGGEG